MSAISTFLKTFLTYVRMIFFDVEKTWSSKCAGKGAALEERCPQLRMVWITCEGATPHDTEYMGPVSYTPTTGVRGFYFPYLNQQLYLK